MQAELKEAKLHARQTQEMAVLRSRGDRGQDELKRAHQQVSVLLSAEEAHGMRQLMGCCGRSAL